MKLIKDFFEKFNKNINEKNLLNETIIEIIFTAAKIKIDKEQILIKNSNLYLKCSPIKRSEIMMNKEIILSELKLKIPNIKINDLK